MKAVFNQIRALNKEYSVFITPRRPVFSKQTAHMAVKSMLQSPASDFSLHLVIKQTGGVRADSDRWVNICLA